MQGAGNGLIFPDNSVVHSRSELIGPQGPAGPQGPQGAQGVQGNTGPQGPAGPNGVSHVYSATGSAYLDHNVYANVVTLTVPAGSYILVARAKVLNLDSDTQDTSCALSDSNSDPQSTADVNAPPADNVYFPLQMIATNVPNGTTITLACGTYFGEAEGIVTAIPVNAIN